MKIRQGFVSNSSSTNYILYIPASVTAQKYVAFLKSKVKKKDEKFVTKEFFDTAKSAFLKIKTSGIDEEELSDHFSEIQESLDEADAPFDWQEYFETSIKPFVLEEIETASDRGFYTNIASKRNQTKMTKIDAEWK